MPVVPQLLLQLRDGLLQGGDLLFTLLILVQPVGNFLRAAEHIRAFLVVQLRQRGNQAAHPIIHHLERRGKFGFSFSALSSLKTLVVLLFKKRRVSLSSKSKEH